MNLPFRIARRYLFSKKSQNIINVITSISVVGVAFSAAAMVIVLSAFNGIEQIVENMYGKFDADIRITKTKGKTFFEKEVDFEKIKEVAGVNHCVKVIEETVLIQQGDITSFATLKGVSPDFVDMVNMNDMMFDGTEALSRKSMPLSLIGIALMDRLAVTADPKYNNVIQIHGLSRTKKISMLSTPYSKQSIRVGGIYRTGTSKDEEYIVTNLNFSRKLLDYREELTAIEIGVLGNKLEETISGLKLVLGEDFKITTKYEKNKLIFAATKNEKVATFVILSFVLIIAAFTLIASLTMLILEKQKDIFTLSAIGFTENKILRLFVWEGVLINVVGAIVGICFGLFVCYLQIWFGFIPMAHSGFEAHPVDVQWKDLVLIILTIGTIGFISSYLPVKYLISKLFSVTEK